MVLASSVLRADAAVLPVRLMLAASFRTATVAAATALTVSLMLKMIAFVKAARGEACETLAVVLARTTTAWLKTVSVLAARLAGVSLMLQGVVRPERVVACDELGTVL